MTDKRLETGPIFGLIGAEARDIVGGDPDGLYIYTEVEQWSVYLAVFRDEGEAIRYYDPTQELSDLILEAWEAEDEDKRWLVMEYEVHGTTFDAHFTFPGEVNPKDDAVLRRRAALKKRYGDRPVVYPRIPDEFEELN